MRRRGRFAVLLASICFALPLTALGNTTQVLRYVSNQRGNPWGRQNLMLTVEPVTGGDRAAIVVPNDPPTGPYAPNKTIVGVIEKAQPGAFFKIEMETIQGLLVVHSIAPYDVKPGEDAPHCFVFVEVKDEKVNGEPRVSIVVNKLGQQSVFTVPNKKDASGKITPDWDMSHDVHGLKPNEVIDVEVRQGLGGLQLVSLDKYTPPQKGEFLALTDVEVEGVKHPAVSVKAAEKTQTLVLPGEMVGKKWVTNGKILGAVKALKANQAVLFQVHANGEQLVLKDIQVDKPAAAAK